MTDREKLIELLKHIPQVNHYEAQVEGINYVFGCAADYLLANDVTFQKWIPVSERLPEQGQEVIVASYRMIKPVVFTTIFWNKEHDNWYGITHWMPLPKPPKEDV